MEFVPETVAPGDIPWSGFYLGFIVWRRNSLSDLDDFSDIVNYIYCNDNNIYIYIYILGGVGNGGGGLKLGILRGSFYPSNTLGRTPLVSYEALLQLACMCF